MKLMLRGKKSEHTVNGMQGSVDRVGEVEEKQEATLTLTQGISGGADASQDDERWGVGKWHVYICNVWLLYCFVQKQVLRFPRCRKFLKHSCSTKHARALLLIWGSLRIRGFRILIWRYVQPRQLITSSAQPQLATCFFFRFGFCNTPNFFVSSCSTLNATDGPALQPTHGQPSAPHTCLRY